ncbi:NACHT domain-containing protein [Saccharothrix sp. HUAS TT1]|uniref:NACHT domain-containing protein n=1 Tax=unclassified Saccharothrix TaxID=2593673 RepID=UPI00345BDD52
MIPILAGVLLPAIGLTLVLGGKSLEIADQTASVIGAAAGVGALLLGVLQERRHQRTTRQGRSVDLDELADRLAETVAAQWSDEERVRGVHDPFPLPVRWTNAPDHLADHWAAIHRTPRRDEPVDLTGHLADVVDVFERIPSRRLVVLGKPGSGKTTLTTRFVLTYLDRAHRAPGQPVPVIFSLTSWDPGRQGLRAWMADRLATTYPVLAVLTETGDTAAHRLLAGGRILPVLDGFDEIAPELRDDAIQQVNRALGPRDPLLLTSRSAEYARAAGVITGSAVVCLADLAPDDVDTYLRLSTSGRTTAARARWAPVLARLRAPDPDPAAQALAAVLRTPLMLSLARAVCSGGSADPADLLRTAAAHDTPRQRQHHLETLLLSHFVPALYRAHGDTPDHRWNPERAHRWLAFLAHASQRRHTDDLAWWRLRQVLRHPRLVGGLVIGLAVGSASWLVIGLVFGFATVLAVGPDCGVDCVNGHGLTYLQSGRELDCGLGLDCALDHALKYGFDRGIGPRFVLGLDHGITFGLAAGLATGVTAGLTACVATSIEPRPRRPRFTWRGLLRDIASGLAAGLLAWLVSGLVIGLGYALHSGFVRDSDLVTHLRTGFRHAREHGLTVGLVVGLIVGLRGEAAGGSTGVVSPDSLLRADRGVALVRIATVGIVAGSTGWLVFGFTDGSVEALMYGGLVFGLGGAAVGSTFTAWGASLPLRLYLAASGRAPWALMAFLRDAHHRGVLRQAGPVYQFRHARLRDQLATEYRAGPDRSGRAAVAGPDPGAEEGRLGLHST